MVMSGRLPNAGLIRVIVTPGAARGKAPPASTEEEEAD
jgi:hypothetical protein